jgi:carbonic anhydrase/acetyltransferase-like protein (isoleucine patch superfamily)
MTLESYLTYSPVLGDRVYVARSAVVIGRATLADDVSIWPTAVVRADVFSIEIGARTNIQDGSVLHVTHDGPHTPGGRALIIGSDVTVGHRVVLHACTIGNSCLIGMGSVVLDDVMIEDEVIVGAGSVIAPGKRLEQGGLYVGSPARRARDLRPEEIEFLAYSASHYVKLKDDYLGMSAGA